MNNDLKEAAREMADIFFHLVAQDKTIRVMVEYDDGTVRMETVRKNQVVEEESERKVDDRFADASRRSFNDTELNDDFSRFRALSADEQKERVKDWKDGERERGEDLC